MSRRWSAIRNVRLPSKGGHTSFGAHVLLGANNGPLPGEAHARAVGEKRTLAGVPGRGSLPARGLPGGDGRRPPSIGCRWGNQHVGRLNGTRPQERANCDECAPMAQQGYKRSARAWKSSALSDFWPPSPGVVRLFSCSLVAICRGTRLAFLEASEHGTG